MRARQSPALAGLRTPCYNCLCYFVSVPGQRPQRHATRGGSPYRKPKVRAGGDGVPKKKKVDLKRIQKQQERRLRNRSVRSMVKTFIAKAQRAMVAPTPALDAVQAAVITAQKVIDSAAQKGVIHKNAAARRKSKLMKRLAQLLKAQQSGAEATA
ncbi:MAG: 30S ribosomal protein S20 [Chloroflexota bacterium]